MKTKKTSFLVIIVIFLIPMAFASSVFTATTNAQTSDTFIWGTGSGPVDLDPANAWDSASTDAILQVCEGLYAYNMSDPNLAIIPWLAASMPVITTDGLNYTVNLRSNIVFQDGYAFNATSCKWSFDRLFNGFINTGVSQFTSLYAAINGKPIVNQTIANANDSITFILNYVYAPFLALLCFSGSLVVAPTISHFNSYYQSNLLKVGNSSDVLLGTGPFLYKGYVADDHVTFQANPNYWGGPMNQQPQISTLIYQIYPDSDTRNNALLGGDIQMIDSPSPDYYNQFNESANVQLEQGPMSTEIQYIGMNTKLIPTPVREACSYAFNYSYANNVIMQGDVDRMTSPIPYGIVGSDAKNSSFNYPITNITYARQVLINNGYIDGNSMYKYLRDPSNDSAWINASTHEPLLSYNYTYNAENKVREEMGTLLASNLENIGIKLVTASVTWSDFLGYVYGIHGLTKNELNFFFVGWIPDYNDPQDYINPLFTPKGGSDSTQLNDTTLNSMMTTALQTTNIEERMGIYSVIQQRIVGQLFPWIMIYVDQIYNAWETGVSGFQQNAMNYHLFLPVSYTPQQTTIPGYNIGLTLLSIFSGIVVVAAIIKKRIL